MGKKKQAKGSSVDIDSNSTSSCSTVSDKKVLTLNSIMSEENEMGPPQNPSLSPLPVDDDGGGAEDHATAAATAAARYQGVEMAAASFTLAQWRELERQTMIYKYMMASVPVPPDLLFSVLSPRTDDPSSYPYPYPYPYFPWMNGNGGSYFRNNKDLEPGRCKRTDGKKWRCSRDVAPHQKYCERHMHRGRPRSRKHVEIHQTSVEHGGVSATARVGGGGGGGGATKKSRLRVDLPPRFLETHTPKESMFVDPLSIFPPSDHFKQPNRVFGWEMEGGNTEQQWLDFMETKRRMDSINGFNSVLQQGYVEEVQIQEQQQQPLSLFSYGMESIDDQCHLFLNSDNHHQEKDNPTRGFIDAWSNGNGDVKSTIPASSSSCSSNLNLWPPCDDTLTLSMALSAAGMGHAPPASWQPFHSGGPLAEVLGPASPYPGNGDSISPPGTSVSSPRGILHRAVFSDGSVGNSPTLAASRAAPDLVAFQWLN